MGRLSQLVGWIAGDTASAISLTAGGRNVSILSLLLFELYEDWAGQLLFKLSATLLPPENNNSTVSQMSAVVKVLHHKLARLAHGTHLANHVTRIRETYLNSDLDIPHNLLKRFSMEKMTEFLTALHKALQEEDSMLYVQGCDGLGHVVASVMVKRQTIYRGECRSVVISIERDQRTTFTIETVLYRGQAGLRYSPAKSEPSGTKPRMSKLFFESEWITATKVNMTIENCLSNAILLEAAVAGSAKSLGPLTTSIVEFITAVVFSFSAANWGFVCQEDTRDDYWAAGQAGSTISTARPLQSSPGPRYCQSHSGPIDLTLRMRTFNDLFQSRLRL
jgi:hypothetical protein